MLGTLEETLPITGGQVIHNSILLAVLLASGGAAVITMLWHLWVAYRAYRVPSRTGTALPSADYIRVGPWLKVRSRRLDVSLWAREPSLAGGIRNDLFLFVGRHVPSWSSPTAWHHSLWFIIPFRMTLGWLWRMVRPQARTWVTGIAYGRRADYRAYWTIVAACDFPSRALAEQEIGWLTERGGLVGPELVERGWVVLPQEDWPEGSARAIADLLTS